MRGIGFELTLKQKIVLLLLMLSVAGWVAFIFSNSLKTAQASDGQSGRIVEFIIKSVLRVSDEQLAADLFGTINFFVRKAAHFTEFSILAVLLFFVFEILQKSIKQCFLLSELCVFSVAVCDELLQTLSAGRACRITDVLIDCCGGVFGFFLVCLIHFVIRIARKRSLNERY